MSYEGLFWSLGSSENLVWIPIVRSKLSVTQRFLELKSKTSKEWGWGPSRKTSKILLVQKHTVQGVP